MIFNPEKHDFTLETYRKLLTALCDGGFRMMTFQAYLQEPDTHEKVVILRHDVDARPQNALEFAGLQAELGVFGTYYFRIVQQSFDVDIIKQIAALGHEIGYHYEDLALAKGDAEKAFSLFQKNLEQFRKYYPVRTVCMHGSPLSKWDNRDLWKRFDYRECGISGEPYFDIDFNKTHYLTDTGRRWDGASSSVRDKIASTFETQFKTTDEIIKAAKAGNLPNNLMINFHPQRWTDSPSLWLRELTVQNTKNVIKSLIVQKRKRHEHKIQDQRRVSYA